MKIKSLLLTLALLFTTQNDCAAANELTLEIAFKSETKKMNQDQINDLIEKNNKRFSWKIESEYKGRWIKVRIKNYKKNETELENLGFTEYIFLPSFWVMQDQYGFRVITNNGIFINFILKDENLDMSQAKKTFN